MDLNRFLRVVRRYRLLVAFGFLVATLLATLSFAKITSGGLVYRQPKQYSSTQQLVVGFAHGQPPQEILPSVPPLPTLAQLYSSFAASTAATEYLKHHGNPRGTLAAGVQVNPDGSASQIVNLSGIGTSRGAAMATVLVGIGALDQLVLQYQNEQHIPAKIRTALSPLGGPTAAKVIKSPSKTRPLFVFVAVLMAFIGLAFILENLRPAVRIEAPAQDRDDDDIARPMSQAKPSLRASDRSG